MPIDITIDFGGTVGIRTVTVSTKISSIIPFPEYHQITDKSKMNAYVQDYSDTLSAIQWYDKQVYILDIPSKIPVFILGKENFKAKATNVEYDPTFKVYNVNGVEFFLKDFPKKIEVLNPSSWLSYEVDKDTFVTVSPISYFNDKPEEIFEPMPVTFRDYRGVEFYYLIKSGNPVTIYLSDKGIGGASFFSPNLQVYAPFIFIRENYYISNYGHEKGHRHAKLCDEYDLQTFKKQTNETIGGCPNKFPTCCTNAVTDLGGNRCGSVLECPGMPHNPDYNKLNNLFKPPACVANSIMGLPRDPPCSKHIYPKLQSGNNYCQLRSNIWGRCQVI